MNHLAVPGSVRGAENISLRTEQHSLPNLILTHTFLPTSESPPGTDMGLINRKRDNLTPYRKQSHDLPVPLCCTLGLSRDADWKEIINALHAQP